MFPFIFLSSFLSGFDWLSWNTSRFTCWKTVKRVHFQLKKYMGERLLSLWLVLSSSSREINAKKGENMGGKENVPYEIKHPDIFTFCIPKLMYIWEELLIAKQAMGLILPSYLSFCCSISFGSKFLWFPLVFLPLCWFVGVYWWRIWSFSCWSCGGIATNLSFNYYWIFYLFVSAT